MKSELESGNDNVKTKPTALKKSASSVASLNVDAQLTTNGYPKDISMAEVAKDEGDGEAGPGKFHCAVLQDRLTLPELQRWSKAMLSWKKSQWPMATSKCQVQSIRRNPFVKTQRWKV